jgi:hypothetical protein
MSLPPAYLRQKLTQPLPTKGGGVLRAVGEAANYVLALPADRGELCQRKPTSSLGGVSPSTKQRRTPPSGATRRAGFMVRPLLVFQSSIFAICLHVIDGIMKLIDKIGIDVARKIV